MTLLDVSLADEPLNIDSFKYLNDDDYPCVLIGFQLRNLYDQKRLLINKKYNPIDVIHFVPNEPLMPKFFRGIKISLKPKFSNLIFNLNKFNESLNDLSKKNYIDLLNQFNLKCNNCFAFFEKGIYPIDSECVEEITNNLCLEDLYDKILNTEENGFQSYGYFTIYVLSNNNSKKTSTNNFIKTALKNYNFS